MPQQAVCPGCGGEELSHGCRTAAHELPLPLVVLAEVVPEEVVPEEVVPEEVVLAEVVPEEVVLEEVVLEEVVLEDTPLAPVPVPVPPLPLAEKQPASNITAAANILVRGFTRTSRRDTRPAVPSWQRFKK